MAKLSVQILNENGDVVRYYDTEGDRAMFDKAFNEAVMITLKASASEVPLSPESLLPLSPKKTFTRENFEPEVHTAVQAPKEERAEPFRSKLALLPKGRKAFTAFRCPLCGKVIFGLHTPDEQCECFNCKKEIKTPKELIFTKYQCTSCGKDAYMYMEKGAISEIDCKQCTSPIDLIFVEKKGEYRSATLLR